MQNKTQRRDIVLAIPSVCLRVSVRSSVCLSNAVTEPKKNENLYFTIRMVAAYNKEKQ